MNFDFVVGIDISKKTLDVCFVDASRTETFQTIANSDKAVNSLLKQITSAKSFQKEKWLFVMEYTGIYNHKLVSLLEDYELHLWQVNPIDIIRSGGIQRGKTDKIDALRIAKYAIRNIDKYSPHIPMREELIQIKRLFAVRRNLVKSKKQIKALSQDYDFLNPKLIDAEKGPVSHALKALKVQIDTIEEEIKMRILNDPKLSRLYIIITSIKGLSFVTAVKIIIVTNEFKKITSPKSLACHCGIAPFEHSSGTSLKRATRVSHMADKELKKLLHLGAVAAIAHPGELRDYYLRKVEQGKHKMKVINNVRNKLVHRVYACVKNDRIYHKKYHMGLTGT